MSEVLRLRPCDVNRREGALVLTNLKQRRRALRQKTVYVSPELVRDLTTYAKDAGLSPTSFFFQSQKSDGLPMSRQHAWRLIQQYAERARVAVVGGDGQLKESDRPGLPPLGGRAPAPTRRAAYRGPAAARTRPDRHDDHLHKAE